MLTDEQIKNYANGEQTLIVAYNPSRTTVEGQKTGIYEGNVIIFDDSDITLRVNGVRVNLMRQYISSVKVKPKKLSDNQ